MLNIMARRGTRRATRKSGKGKLRLFSRVYSPLSHLLQATRNVTGTVFKRSGKIVEQGLGIVDNTGKALTKHANQAVSNVVRGTRKNRKNSRRNRK